MGESLRQYCIFIELAVIVSLVKMIDVEDSFFCIFEICDGI